MGRPLGQAAACGIGTPTNDEGSGEDSGARGLWVFVFGGLVARAAVGWSRGLVACFATISLYSIGDLKICQKSAPENHVRGRALCDALTLREEK